MENSSDKRLRLSIGGARRSTTERGGAERSGAEREKKLYGEVSKDDGETDEAEGTRERAGIRGHPGLKKLTTDSNT